MNDDPFETRLQSLRRRDLAADWKTGILATAAASLVSPGPRRVPLTPPRWLAWGLAAIWALVAALTLTTPSTGPTPDLANQTSDPGSAIQQRQELFATLLSTSIPSTP